MYTADIYYGLFPKKLPYTSTGIPIHQRPMRPRPHDPHNRPFGALLCGPDRGHRAGRRSVGTAPTALGLFIAANRQVAGPSCRGDPRPVALGSVFRGPIAPRAPRQDGPATWRFAAMNRPS